MPSERKTLLSRARNWYGRFERPLSSISLVGGFVFDAVTLQRVDVFWDNLWVVGHIAIVTICAVWINLLDNTVPEGGRRPETDPARLHFWLVNVMQFFFGGILSVYLVFYFRGGTFATSWPFLVILALAFYANESLKRHYARLTFQITLLFLAFYAFAIYMMPILLHELSTRVFLASGVVSVAAIGLIIILLRRFSRERFAGKTGRFVFASIVVILIVVNGLYFSNLIPPLPLSLKNADVYHTLVANGPGNYLVSDEYQSSGGPLASIGFLARFFAVSQTVHVISGDPLVAYTAIFSPTALNTNIVHEWQRYDAASSTWITYSRIPLTVVGGRDGGYRTFSRISTVTAGTWRVNVETPGGQVIGRLNFDVVTQNAEPALVTRTIE